MNLSTHRKVEIFESLLKSASDSKRVLDSAQICANKNLSEEYSGVISKICKFRMNCLKELHVELSKIKEIEELDHYLAHTGLGAMLRSTWIDSRIALGSDPKLVIYEESKNSELAFMEKYKNETISTEGSDMYDLFHAHIRVLSEGIKTLDEVFY